MDILNDFEPISFSSVDFNDVQVENDFYTFSGFPYRKSKFYNGVLKSELFSYTGYRVNDKEYEKLGYDKKYNIVMSFNRENAVKITGEKYKTPLPEGISGGAVFSCSKHKSSIFRDDKVNRLVGIGHTFHPKSQMFVGTSINMYFMAIYNNNPHLRPQISNKHFLPVFMGVAYFLEEEWTEIRNIMEDKASMPESYVEWRTITEKYLDHLYLEGKQYFRIILTLEEILNYSKVRSVPLNAKLRLSLVTEKMKDMIFETAIIS